MRALAELGERFGATDAPRRRWSAREGSGQLGTDLAAAGAVAAVLASGAGLGARPLSPAILAFAALLTMTMFEVAGSLAATGPAAGQALAARRRLTEMTALGARQAPADPAAQQPQAPESGAWARDDITLFPAPSSPPFTTARWTTCRCPRMPPSGSLREESSG